MAAPHLLILRIIQVVNILLGVKCMTPTIITGIGLLTAILTEKVLDTTEALITGARAQAAMSAPHLQCAQSTTEKVCHLLRRGLGLDLLLTEPIIIPPVDR